jgi:hypothetical protein
MKIMKRNLLTVLFLAFAISGFSQALHWAYSFQNQAVLESMTDVASNGTDRFAIIGNGNSGITMDPLGSNPLYNSSGNFIACYDASAAIQWIAPAVGTTFGVQLAANGDVYVCGGFSGTQDFDPSGGNFPLTATGFDSYLQKFNADGTFAWAASASAEGTASEIEVLADGRVIVAGRSDVDATVTLANSSTVALQKGIFILEFNATGSLVNAYSISVPSPTGYGYVYELTSDANNNVYLGGSIDGIGDFDLGAGTANNTATSAYDAFCVKYSSSFQLQWFRQFGDANTPTGWDKLRGLAVDAAGNVFAGGEFTWTTDFDPANPGTNVLVSDLASQVPSGFLLQWSPSGALNWVNKIGNNNSGVPTESASVAVTQIALQNSNLYVGLEGWGYWDVDPSANNEILVVGAVASVGIGFGKYSNAGDYLAAFAIDTNAGSTGLSTVGMGMLGTDQLVTAGKFNKQLDFDPTGSSTFLQTDVNGGFYEFDNDLYIAKYGFGGSTNIAQDDQLQPVFVYPNPFQSQLNVRQNLGGRLLKFNLYDAQGKLVLTGQPDMNGNIQTPMLPNGFYTLELLANPFQRTWLKVVKEGN